MRTTRKNDFIPAIHDQGVIKHDIPNNLLAPQNNARFNGSIIRHEGIIRLAYRRYDPRTGLTSIAISHLNNEFHPTANYDCDLPPKCDVCIQEDCRLFHYNNELWISYTELNKGLWDKNQGRDIYQCHAKLQFDGIRYYATEAYRPQYKDNIKGVEKNWTYFQVGKDLYSIYDIGNGIFLKMNPHGDDCEEIRNNQKVFYPYGYIRGGTPPVINKDGLYQSFFHGSSQDAWLGRRYYMGAFTFEPDTFKIVSISKKPIVFGSKLEEFCGDGNGMCVFPMGSLFENNQWIVSCGINDTYNCIIIMSDDQVKQTIVPASNFNTKNISYYKCDGREQTYQTISGLARKWIITARRGSKGIIGYLATTDPESIKSLKSKDNVVKVTKKEYTDAIDRLSGKTESPKNRDYVYKDLTLDSRSGLSILR